MAVQAGWVGTSAKAETGMAWMGDARVALRLPRAGWMSGMVGVSKEIRFVNNTNRTQANIHTLMGSPTEVTAYVFENNVTISAASRGGWALQTGNFPAGSTLTIVNRGFIRGGGGNSTTTTGQKGGDALILNLPTRIDNTQGYIYGGGGGGGSGYFKSFKESGTVTGGGGAGTPAGTVATGTGAATGSSGTASTGGAGKSAAAGVSGNGGGLGQAGATARGFQTNYSGGAAGRSVVRNGHTLTWLGGNDTTRVRGAVV